MPRALAELAALGDDGTIQGFLWHQGESDGSEPYASQYAANFSNLVAHLRADLNLPALRVVVGDLNTNKNAAVRAALAAVGDDPLGGFAPSTGFATVDGTHFDTPAVIEFGQRYARAMRDVDEDGCRDLWELDHFDSLAVAQGDATDYDHDGASDRAEDIAGTNPTNAASFFRTSGGRDAGGGLVLSWPGATGRTYRVWRTLDWGASWSDISGALPTNVHTDSAPPSSVGFYRVSVQAP